MVQQNLGNVQPGKMCSDTCVAESPKPVAKPFESVADYGSSTALQELCASQKRKVLRAAFLFSFEGISLKVIR
jgi:hypothetical protein